MGRRVAEHLAAVQAWGGDLEQGYAVALRVAGIARSTGSERLRRLRRLRSRLAARWPDDARVAEAIP